jgi:PIN domain nuclease of toxin-antitoxin system
MSYLLDSHVLLWWLEDSARINTVIRKTIADPEVPVLVSAATVWEIGIKQALGKLQAPESVIDLLQDEGFEELPITAKHAAAAASLPALHRDPFDRMLVAQARLDKLILVTHDEVIQAYDVDVRML